MEKRGSGLTQNQRLYFLNGWCPSVSASEGPPGFPFKNKREYRSLYFNHRSEIFAAANVSAKDRAPLEDMDWDRLRPAAWWEFEGPEKRLFCHNPHAEFDCLERHGLASDRDKEIMAEIHQQKEELKNRRKCFRLEE
ncbi:MAG: hypothetical protein ACE144_16020 [Thermodesulfobacteriota bacterium]